MDIARPDIPRKKRRQRILSVSGALVLIALVSAGISRLRPAAPLLDTPAFTDAVKRGQMLREVRGSGVLVPEEIRWITASSPGRIDNITLLPGVTVTANTILVELSNPELEQAAFEAQSQWHAAQAQSEKLKVQLESDRLTELAVIATLKSDMVQAKIEADADETLRKDGLVPTLVARKSRAKADELDARLQLEQKRLDISADSTQAQLRAQAVEVERLNKLYQLKAQQVEALKVRAGCDGVLQRLGDDRPLQVGQQLVAGAIIARIANQSKLKAEIKISETQARDIQENQHAEIDTRNGVVAGHVVRIDPAVLNGTVTVDVKLDAAPPRGSRPDLSVDGTITLERLEDVLYAGRPVNGQANSLVNLFKVVDDGKSAVRVPVRLGRSSVSQIEIVDGLRVGDQIILSDMSQWDSYDRVRLK
jgi:HlyD family secretion protein